MLIPNKYPIHIVARALICRDLRDRNRGRQRLVRLAYRWTKVHLLIIQDGSNQMDQTGNLTHFRNRYIDIGINID